MRTIQRFQAVASLLAAALVLAACGGSEPASTTDAQLSTTEVTEAPPTTTTTIHEEEHTETTHAHDEEGEADHDDADVDDADVDVVVEVLMNEFAFSPDTIEVQAGQTVKFIVHNEGLIEHEFRLSNTHRIEEHIASGHDDHEEGGEGGHHGEDADLFVLVDAGEIGELVVSFPEDTSIYADIACLLPGHYEAGMLGSIEYSEA